MVFAKLLAHSRCSVRPSRDSLLRLTAANRSAGWAEAASPVMPGARNSVGWTKRGRAPGPKEVVCLLLPTLAALEEVSLGAG